MLHQVHDLPVMEQGADFVKLGFDESCLSLLPKQYPFLIDPLNYQKVHFTRAGALRIKAILAMLLDLLSEWDTPPELILAHLNSLLTEINAAYFKNQKHVADDKLSKFIAFKAYIENTLTEQPGITSIAAALGVNTNALYQLTMKYAGVSPKAFMTNRLMLEARRRIYYAQKVSIKELAFELGFNDPEYFSRLFKKVTGQTIVQFSQDLSGN
jgi:AraC family transcriptional activator of pobA